MPLSHDGRQHRQDSRSSALGALPASVSLLRDLPIVFAGLALFYGLLSLTRYWAAPVNAQAEIHLSPGALPKYALFSVARIAVAYLSAWSSPSSTAMSPRTTAKAERFLIPLLDTLQSIPVLSFLPGVMVAMVALFPTRQLGVELGSILLIFTGQVWNMTFSVYSSLKNIPREMREAAQVYRLSWWQTFMQLELPYAAIGLVWNSMMSVAGGWFFLMACEMFVLGNRDLRLPGLGSYLQTAANAGDTRRDPVGPGGHDRGDRPDRPVRLASHHRLEREVQVRAGGSLPDAALAGARSAAPLQAAVARCPGLRRAGARSLDSAFCPKSQRVASSPAPARAARNGLARVLWRLAALLASSTPS